MAILSGAKPRLVIRRSTDTKLLRRMQKRILPGDTPIDPGTDGVFWWVAWDGPKAIGFASLTRDNDIADGDFGHLSRAGVDKAYRGLGLQKRLIRVRLAHAKRIMGWKICVTDTQWWNAASSNSLIACGFKTFRPANPWMGDGTVYWKKRL